MKFILLLVFLLVAVTAHAQLVPLGIQGSAAAEGSHTFAGTIFNGVTVSWNGSTLSRYFMLFDATSVPANGSTTSCNSTSAQPGCLAYCAYVPSSGTSPSVFSLDWTQHPAQLKYGVTVAFSSASDCGTFTLDNPTNFFYSQTH